MQSGNNLGNVGTSKLVPFPYKQGFFVGRMQHIHIGHESIINKALAMCEHLVILVGSSQVVGTERNPFAYELRMELVAEIYKDYPDRVVVADIPDLSTEDDFSPEWGEHVLYTVSEYAHYPVDLMVYGMDENRAGWFSPEQIIGIDQLVVPRGNVQISATSMREFLVSDDYASWCEFANPKIHPYYSLIRQRLLEVPCYGERAL